MYALKENIYTVVKKESNFQSYHSYWIALIIMETKRTTGTLALRNVCLTQLQRLSKLGLTSTPSIPPPALVSLLFEDNRN